MWIANQKLKTGHSNRLVQWSEKLCSNLKVKGTKPGELKLCLGEKNVSFLSPAVNGSCRMLPLSNVCWALDTCDSLASAHADKQLSGLQGVLCPGPVSTFHEYRLHRN